MFTSFSEAEAFILENKIRMIDLKFCDLWGKWHHVTISSREFNEKLLINGIGFDGSSVGFKSVHSGDMALIPDLATAFLDPFWEINTLSFICNTVEADTKKLFSGEPREIARKAEEYLISKGFSDQSIWGPEFEFYIFNNISYENGVHSASYKVDSQEAIWNSSSSKHGHLISPHGGYHIIPPLDQHYQLRAKMVDNLENVGIPIKYHHHEVGASGQHEIETPLMGLIRAADASMIIKYVTKMTAHENGQSVTFLPKPLFGEAGSGMHFHQQLRKDGKNIFYNPDGRNLLSNLALYYIGGLLKHAPAVLAFTNPSTNSYRRLVPGYEAPVNSFFSSGNRSAAIRVPRYATEPDKVRFEFRPPDGTCNPYLAMAAMLMAGVDGILNEIDPTEAGFGPIDEDIFSWPAEKRKSINSLPTSLDEAVNALKQDHQFLLSGGVFTRDLIDLWISAKTKESESIKMRPHPYEFEMYFNF